MCLSLEVLAIRCQGVSGIVSISDLVSLIRSDIKIEYLVTMLNLLSGCRLKVYYVVDIILSRSCVRMWCWQCYSGVGSHLALLKYCNMASNVT